MDKNTEGKITVSVVITIVALGVILYSIQAIESPNKTITSTEYTNTITTVTTQITNTTTTMSHITTISCKTLVNGNNGAYHGSLPNGTNWVSIDGNVYYGKNITTNAYPYNNPNSILNWWIINNC